MDDVVTQIEALETAVADAIGRAGAPATRPALERSYVQAVLDLVQRLSLDLTGDELTAFIDRGDLDAALRETFAGTYGAAAQQLAADVAARTRDVVQLTRSFYDARGVSTIGVNEATARAQVTKTLSEGFQSALSKVNRELFEATAEIATRAALAGTFDTATIEADIIAQTGVAGARAITQAQVAVGAYNQAWRQQLADQAGLSHSLYYGTLKANSRHFCRVCLGRVFTAAQIEELDNGQIDPVSLFRGGYRCRHSWLPVDPAWSPELKAKLVDAEPVRVQVDLAGNSHITVAVPPTAIARLEHQIRLQYAVGGVKRFTVFQDATTNDTGFVAFHQDWLDDRLRSKGTARAAFDEQERTAVAQAETGSVTRLMRGDAQDDDE